MLRWSSDNEVKTGSFGCTSVLLQISLALILKLVGVHIFRSRVWVSLLGFGGFERSSGSTALNKLRFGPEISPNPLAGAFLVLLTFI